MRKELGKGEGLRKKFRGVFVRTGKKVSYHGYSEDTILLQRIIDVSTNKVVTDHVWFNYTKGFENVHLAEGTVVEFEARVKEYTKGYVNRKYNVNNRSRDYKLSHPTKIKVVAAF